MKLHVVTNRCFNLCSIDLTPAPSECDPGFWKCADGNCIDERRKCDRRQDCRDGSDEIGCDEGMEFII